MENTVYGLCVTKMDIPATEFIIHRMSDVTDFYQIGQTINEFLQNFKDSNPEGTELRIIPSGTKAMLACLVYTAALYGIPIRYFHYIVNTEDGEGYYYEYKMNHHSPIAL